MTTTQNGTPGAGYHHIRSTEPLLVIGVVTALLGSVTTLLVQFGILLTDGQQAAISGVVTVLGALSTAVWGRSKVFAPATVERLLVQSGVTATANADAA